MRKSQASEHKKKIEQKLADLELVTIFLAHKYKENARSPYLKMFKTKRGSLQLLCRRSLTDDNYLLLAEHGEVNSEITKKKLLVLSPENGTVLIIKAIFGGYPTDRIYWKIGLTPLTIDKALSINDAAVKPLLHMEV